ncbi:MAG: hypothetical protein JSU90_11735, partial [Nitrospiraceae bacterium]
QACSTGQAGVCEAGTSTCDTGGFWGACVQDVQASAEVCGDGLDNDCDGATDNGFNVGANCTVGVGACQNTGKQVCRSDGSGTECNVSPLPAGTEGPADDPTCSDGVDNDCDGTTDGADAECAGSATAAFPFKEDFESGSLASYWDTRSTGKGRILVTKDDNPCGGSYHVTMDSGESSSYSLNELTLTVDLAGRSNVKLSFYHKEFNDESHALPSAFTGSYNGDGVSVSVDNVKWYRVQGLTSADNVSNYCKRFVVDLDTAIRAANINYNSSFKVRFQQYDNYSISNDGFAFDQIEMGAVADGKPPYIEKIEQDSGEPGDRVEIRGRDFGRHQTNSYVQIGSVRAQIR